MKCHGCHNAPAEVGLLCRACVEANRARAQQRKQATFDKIQRSSEQDSLLHQAANSWLFRALAIAAFFVVSFLIISTSGRSASADLKTKILLAMFFTSTLVGLASYVWLGLSMYANESGLHGWFILVVYILFPGAVWRWALSNLEQTRSILVIHYVGTAAIFLSLSMLSQHRHTSWGETLEYITRRNAQVEPYSATVGEEWPGLDQR